MKSFQRWQQLFNFGNEIRIIDHLANEKEMKLEQQVPANDGDEDILVRAFEDILFFSNSL